MFRASHLDMFFLSTFYEKVIRPETKPVHHEHQSGADGNSGNFNSGNAQASPGEPMSAKPKKTMHKCAYCGTSFDRAMTTAMPFCSERCRQIDLGNWLDESYGLPYEGEGTLDRAEEDSGAEE